MYDHPKHYQTMRWLASLASLTILTETMFPRTKLLNILIFSSKFAKIIKFDIRFLSNFTKMMKEISGYKNPGL